MVTADRIEKLARAQLFFADYMELVHDWRPRPHQEPWVRAIQDLRWGQLRNAEGRRVNKLAIVGFPGCIAGDALLHVNRAGKGRAMPIEHVWRRWNGVSEGTGAGPGWDRSIPTYVRSLVDGELRLNLVKDVVHSGTREVVQVDFESGRRLKCTPDHLIAQPDGAWTSAGLLQEGDSVVANGKYVDRDGYVIVFGHHLRDHPRAHKSSTTWEVREHLLVMESAIGRPVSRTEVVHHINGVKHDNHIENLQLLDSHAAHMRHHPQHTNLHNGKKVWFVPCEDKVVSVTPAGRCPTFDLVMDDPWRNFVANGVVVHNSGKTDTAIEACAWLIGSEMTMGRHPQIGYFCYAEDVATSRSVAVRNTIEHMSAFHQAFPMVQPNKAQGWGQMEWYIQRLEQGKKDPTFRGVGMKGGILSYRFPTLMVIDDPHNTPDLSLGQKDEVWNIYQTSINTRGLELTPTLLICTRFANDDLFGRLMETEPELWAVVHTPALLGEEGDYRSAWPPEEMPNGEIKGLSTDFLLGLRSRQPATFTTQYQALPPSSEGDIFKRFQIGPPPATEEVTRVCQYWDTAVYATGDYQAMVELLRLANGRCYVNKTLKLKADTPGLMGYISQEYQRALEEHGYKVRVYVENKANGGAVVDLIVKRGGIPIKALDIKRKSLPDRARAASTFFDTGNIYLPQHWTGWKDEFLNALRGYQGLKNESDDLIAATVLGVEHQFMLPINRPRPRQITWVGF